MVEQKFTNQIYVDLNADWHFDFPHSKGVIVLSCKNTKNKYIIFLTEQQVNAIELMIRAKK